MKRLALVVLGASLLCTCLFCACGGGDGGGNYACSYESRHTGCNNSTWTEWEAECFSFNSDDYYITPEEVCANVTDGGVYCEAGCCIDTEFRNVDLSAGDCS